MYEMLVCFFKLLHPTTSFFNFSCHVKYKENARNCRFAFFNRSGYHNNLFTHSWTLIYGLARAVNDIITLHDGVVGYWYACILLLGLTILIWWYNIIYYNSNWSFNDFEDQYFGLSFQVALTPLQIKVYSKTSTLQCS